MSKSPSQYGIASYEDEDRSLDFEDRDTIHRLRQAVDTSYNTLRPYREKRLEIIQQYVGRHYGEGATNAMVPVNYIEMAMSIYQFRLVAETPRVLVTSPHRYIKPLAANLRLAANRWIERTDQDPSGGLKDELQAAIFDAMVSIGVIMVGLEDGGDSGIPFARHIDFDDIVFDVSASRLGDACFIGNRFRMPLEEARENPNWDKKAREALQPTRKGDEADPDSERASRVGDHEPVDPDEYEPHTDLLNLYLPREDRFVTLPDVSLQQNPAPQVLYDETYEGPPAGPYRFLCFNRMPGKIMPLPPALVWIDLHKLANRLFRKITRQADRQKTVMSAQVGDKADAQKIKEASDGEIILTDTDRPMQEYNFGGVENTTLMSFLQVKELINYFAGNLEVMGGLGPQADTATQEELLAENSSSRISFMQSRVESFVSGILHDVCWWLWTDPVTTYDLVKTVPGTTLEVPTRLTPDDRQRPLTDFDITVDPYSMRPQTPAARLQTLMRVVQQFLPLAPLMAQQGITFDFQGLMRKIANLANLDELNEILIFTKPVPQPDEGSGTPKPNQTTRRYERINRPGASRRGNDQTMQRILAGAGVQNSEAEAVLRGA